MLKRLSVLAVAVAVASLAVTGVAAAAENPDGPAVSVPDGTSAVIITEDVTPSQDPCLPAPLALSNVVQNTPGSFTLRIQISAPLCEPVRAAAVVYAMPGKGVAWPQQLVERTDFTLKDPGVVTVRFDKACDPVQFDVITGASPAVISPDGAWHGPLLFPTDVSTALQYWGDGPECPTTTTTTTTTSSTVPSTIASTTSSTTTPSVLPTSTVQTTTTVAVAGATTINTTPPQAAAVAGISATNGTSTGGSSLAFTGSRNGDLTRLGLVLVALGLGLGLLARRRPTPAAD